MNERKLQAWIEAGVVDPDAAARIRGWEASHARPLALWAVIGIGALAIALGIMLVVAANWDDIPPMLRLSLHLALLAGLLGAVWWRGDQLAARQPWWQEALLFVCGALGLTFLAHLGQVYQTTSPLWQPVAVWLVLFGPVLLLRGRSWLTAVTVMLAAGVAANDYAGGGYDLGSGELVRRSAYCAALISALPILAAAVGALAQRLSTRADFWRRIEQLGLIYAVGMASWLALWAGYLAGDLGGTGTAASPYVAGALVIRAAVALASAALLLLAPQEIRPRAAAAVLCAAGLTMLLSQLSLGHNIASALLFMALWCGVAAAAILGGWRVTFQLAVAAVALRLIVLSFELDDNLLDNGLGLIAGGVITLAVAGAATVVARRFAPPREAQP